MLDTYATQNNFSNNIDYIMPKLYFSFSVIDKALLDNIEPRLHRGSRVHYLRLFLGEGTVRSYQLWAILILHENKVASVNYIRVDITNDDEKSTTVVASSIDYDILKTLNLAYPFRLIAKHYTAKTTGPQTMKSLIKFAYIRSGHAEPRDNILGEPDTSKNSPWDRMKAVIAFIHDNIDAAGEFLFYCKTT